MTPALAVFDLDGTLIATGPDLTDSCNHILRAHGFPEAEPAALFPFIGLGARRMIAGGLEANGIAPDGNTVDRLFADYLVHYESRIARFSKPFPEMRAALDTLDAAGVGSAICTNKREDLATKLMDELGLLGRFQSLVGGNTVGIAKPDPAPLFAAIERAGSTPERTVFVGDSRVDRETATNAGVPFVGVTYGYTDVPMEELAPDRLCQPGEDVAEAILSLLGVGASA